MEPLRVFVPFDFSGVDVLHQKSELKREFERRQTRKKPETKPEPQVEKSPFALKLEEQAKKIEKVLTMSFQ